MRADAGPRTVKVRAHTRTIKPKQAALAAEQAFKSQGAAVAKQAYVAAPLATRRAAVRAARKAPPGVERSAVLGVHGRRRGDEHVALRLGAGQVQQPQSVQPTNVMPRAAFTKAELQKIGFKGFKGYTKRAQQGKLGKRELKVAKAVTSTPAPHLDPFATLAKAGLGGTKSATLFTMNQLLRPSTAAGYALSGKSPVQGFKHPEKNTEIWNKLGAKVAGKHKLLAGAVGLTGSILADPTTYATFGLGSAARQAATHAFEAELARSGSQALAGRAARKAFEEAAPHLKYGGVKVGLRGTPARAIRRATGGPTRAPVYTRPLSFGRTREFAAKHGVKHVPVTGKVTRNLRTALSAATRPHDIGQVEWDIIHRGGTAARAGERTAQRKGEHRLRAYHRQGLDEAALAKIARAVEDVHTEASPEHAKVVFAAHGLSEHEQQVAHQLRADVLEQARAEGIPTSGPRVGFSAKPQAPTIGHVPVAETRAELNAAERALRTARTRATAPEALRKEVENARAAVRTAHRAHGEAKGRRAMAEAHTGPMVGPSLGQVAAEQRLAAATQRLRDATQALRSGHAEAKAGEVSTAEDRLRRAKSAHVVNLKASRAARQQLRDYQRQLSAFVRAPKGYVPREVKPGALTEAGGVPVHPGRGLGVNAQKRSVPLALKHMTPEQLGKYDPRLDVVLGHRTVKSYRRRAAADLNERLAGLGDRVGPQEAAALVHAAQRPGGAHVESEAGVFIRDATGFKPAFDKWGNLDANAIQRASARGQEIVRVDARHMAKARDLARGSKDVGAQHVLSGYVAATRGLKVAQTQINPNFHLRNLMGDLWNAAGQGARLRDLPDAFRLSVRRHYMDVAEKNLDTTPAGKAAVEKLKQLDKHKFKMHDGTRVTGTELLGMAEQYGAIKTGIGAAELRAAARGEDITEAGAGRKALDKLTKLGDVREDFGRLISFKRGLEQGLSPERAAQSALVSHFDYSNLTRAEQKIRDYFIPFWTFFARNTALQVRTLGTHPGLYATTEKTRRQTLSAAGIDPNIAQHLQGFEQENLPWGTPAIPGATRFKVPGGLTVPVTAGPALPYTDIGNLPFPVAGGKQASFQNFINGIVSRANPLLRMPYEITNQINTFTGQQRQPEQGTLVPAPTPFKLLPKEIQKLLGMRMYNDKRSGKRVLGVPNSVLAASKLFPVANLASKAGTPAPPGSPNPLGLTLAGWLTGPRYAAQDPRAIEIGERWDHYNRLLKQSSDLKQRVSGHKPREPWGGKIKRLQDEMTKDQHRIYQLGKQLGIKNPAGLPPAKGRRRGAKLGSFGGASYGGAKIKGFTGGGLGG